MTFTGTNPSGHGARLSGGQRQRIAVLHAGRLVELGPPDQLLRRPHGLFIRLHSLQALSAAFPFPASA